MLKSSLFLAILSFGFVQSALEFTYTCPNTCDFELNEDNNQCYHFSLSAVDWEAASVDCAKLDADSNLVKIDDSAENNYVKDKLDGDSFWIGLNDKAVDETWTYVTVADTSVPYFNWDLFQPSGTTLIIFDEDCVQMTSNGKWNDLNCDDDVRFVCEVAAKKEIVCPDGWVGNPDDAEEINACYQFVEEAATFEDAAAKCAETDGATFYAPTTDAENTFVTSQMTTSDYWLGVTDTTTEGTYLIKSTDVEQTYFNWNFAEPGNGGLFGDEDCVIAFYSGLGTGNWNDVDCADKTYPFVCKMLPS